MEAWCQLQAAPPRRLVTDGPRPCWPRATHASRAPRGRCGRPSVRWPHQVRHRQQPCRLRRPVPRLVLVTRAGAAGCPLGLGLQSPVRPPHPGGAPQPPSALTRHAYPIVGLPAAWSPVPGPPSGGQRGDLRLGDVCVRRGQSPKAAARGLSVCLWWGRVPQGGGPGSWREAPAPPSQPWAPAVCSLPPASADLPLLGAHTRGGRHAR